MIVPTDKTLQSSIQEKIDNLNKPKGSLGRLESLAMQVCLIQNSLTPKLKHPCHILFGGDHGIEKENVSASPREVTWQQMINYGKGGGGVNMFCRQHDFSLRVVDVGVDYDLEGYTHIIHRKIQRGTANFRFSPAMNATDYSKALSTGAEQVDECFSEGCNVISFGEMGIANTSPSSILMHLLLGIPLGDCVGAGSGLNAQGVQHKYEVLKESVDTFLRCNPSAPIDTILSYFAGFEMVAAIGAMLRAAELRMIVLVDGFIMTACMLAAAKMDKNVLDYAVFGHQGDEGGHKLMLQEMGAEPLLHLGMRLGEGTGAICAYPILQSAVNMINEMDNFAHAQITKYF